MSFTFFSGFPNACTPYSSSNHRPDSTHLPTAIRKLQQYSILFPLLSEPWRPVCSSLTTSLEDRWYLHICHAPFFLQSDKYILLHLSHKVRKRHALSFALICPSRIQSRHIRGTDIIDILFFFWNAVQMIQTQYHNIQIPVHPEILTDFFCL